MMTKSSSGGFTIAGSAPKLDVNDRIALRYYYRIADNILKQADIFREEDNIIDLYVMLLRFSSLVSETIPCHREYRASPQSNKMTLKKKLLSAVSEMEMLKPKVQKIAELNRRHIDQANGWGHVPQNSRFDSSLEWPPIKKQSLTSFVITKTQRPAAQGYSYQGSRTQPSVHAKPVEEQFRRLSLTIPCPKEETRSRHSILGPNGLYGQWQPPSNDKRVQYPSNIDLTPVEIPRENSLRQAPENGVLSEKASSASENKKLHIEAITPLNDDEKMNRDEEPASLISFESVETPLQTAIIRQPSPPPVLADVQDLIPPSDPVTEADHGMEYSLSGGLVSSESPLQLHISTTLMDSFMKLAKSNTDKNLETCGVLAGSLKNRKFYVTALIIPKQESTSDSCQTTNEEEIFEVQDKQSLFPLGWIHTHPTQSCFMSSIDVHTHYSYQIMLPEAIAIVMAPKDSSRNHGIFRLTTPGGMSVIRQCPRRGFHPHDPPPDGGPIYKQCTDVYMDPKVRFDVIDLR
ncbi:AMSH-like ubiquitin thioesterase 1 isoform X1 [Rhododendron vialii]|uniref:AMSH-like ubiquitin thioesterase 1 isoform X1 n=2 Tax=Rhododendron vialii TaxID=182163 RepID=UPI00265EC6A4|nr:AMSH-like ubiquitin thioesterase 1 isoform X1 [Rhododendron vialii]